MSRVTSPQGRRRVRTIIGRSNRRQLLNPFDGTFEAPRCTPTPGLDGTMFDGDVDSYFNNQTTTTRVGLDGEGPSFPSLPVRCNTAMSMTNNTIGHASAASLREEEVSWQWGKAGLFEDTLGPDQGPRRSHSSLSTRGAGRANLFRRTDVASVSVTLSPDPDATKSRLTAATRTKRLKNVPTALDLLSTLSGEKKVGLGDRSGMVAKRKPVIGLCGVTPGPMVFDDPKYLQCPTIPNNKVSGAIAKQLNAATDGTSAAHEQTPGAGVCANGAWVMRKSEPHHSPSRNHGGPDGMDPRTSLSKKHGGVTPMHDYETPSAVLRQVPKTTNDVTSRLERTGYTHSSHVVQPPENGATYLNPSERYNSTNRGLGASLDAQEAKLRSLGAQQRRVERKRESHRQADLRARGVEDQKYNGYKTAITKKAALLRVHEGNSAKSTYKVTPPNSFEALMDP